VIPVSPSVDLALRTLGALYSWAEGTPGNARTRWPDGPYDCGGHAQAVLVMADVLPSTAPDRGSAGLANACDPVALSDLQPLDLVFYGTPITHVAVYIGGGMVVTMSGGGPQTHGGDPLACAQARPIDYRKDRKVCGRLKPEHRA